MNMFEEVIDFVEERKIEAADMFKNNDEAMRSAGNIIRPLSILGCMFGFYLLFSPIITLLTWIPLVGSLLSMIVGLAVAIFAFVVGGTIACLVLGLAWLWFRPLLGIGLLTVTGLGIALIFLIPSNDSSTSEI
jgi:Transmembrane protein 43